MLKPLCDMKIALMFWSSQFVFSWKNTWVFVLTKHWLLFEPKFDLDVMFLTALQTCYDGLNSYRISACPPHHHVFKSLKMDNT